MAIIDTRLSDKFEVEEDYYTQRDDEYHISSIGKCPRFLFLERTQRRKDS